MAITVGVLALQGDFLLHKQSLSKAGVSSKLIRWPDDLDNCQGLIIPGGESTTFIKLLKETGLFDTIKDFAKERGVMGTCAGLITCATTLYENKMETLGLINMEVLRNGYGRQVNSFQDTVTIPILENKPNFPGIFIRAPRICSMGPGTEPIGFHGKETVMARSDRILAMTFHPELTRDVRIHSYFIEEFIERKP